MTAIEHVEEFVYLVDSAQHLPFFKQNDAVLKQLARQIKQSGIHVGTTLAVFEFINNCLSDSLFQNFRCIR